MSLGSLRCSRSTIRPCITHKSRKQRHERVSSTLLSKATEIARAQSLSTVKSPDRFSRRFYPIERALHLGQPRRAAATAHHILDKSHYITDEIRAPFYSHTIRRFVEAQEWDKAHGFYQRMKAEGWLTAVDLKQSPQLASDLSQLLTRKIWPEDERDLTFLLKGSTRMHSSVEKVEQLIGEAVGSSQWGEPELAAILQHLIRGKTSIHRIRRLMDGLKEKMGSGWEPDWEACALMAQAEAQYGYMKRSMEWFNKSKTSINSVRLILGEDGEHQAKQAAYQKLLLGMAAFGNYLPSSFNQIILRMRKDNVVPTLRISNLLIQHYANEGRADKSFTFYRSMKHANPPIKADNHTFYTLFSADASNVPEQQKPILEMGGRRLFRDMTRQHLSNTNHRPQTESNVLSTAVLNAALRYFMRKHDYAAATVTMRTFPVCQIRPNRNTHHTVIDNLLARVQREISDHPGTSAVTWVDRFVGEMVRLWKDLSMVDVSRLVMNSVKRGSRACRVDGVDIRFLLAILRRALLATWGRWPGRDKEIDDLVVRRAMTVANRQMLPPKASNTKGWYMTESSNPILA